MRTIGQNKWIIASKDLEEGDIVFEKAKYLGEEEGNMGPYHVFQDLETKECYNIGGGHLHYLCQQIAEGDVVKLTYLGEETVESGKWKGKNTHKYEMLLYEDSDLGVGGEETKEEPVEEKSTSKSSSKSKRGKAEAKSSKETSTKTRGRPKKQAEPEPEEDEDDELDELEDL